jgi:CheY-like chemotaxis protein/signal transduction histidine kinase/CHASE3 domain sensor protein
MLPNPILLNPHFGEVRLSPVTANSKVFQRILTRNIALPLAMSVVLCAVFITLLLNLLAANQRVNHSNVVLGAGYETFKFIIDAETGIRGFLITGREEYLTPYERAVTRLPGLRDELKALVAEDRVQQGRLQQILGAYNQWQSLALRTIENRRKGRAHTAEQIDTRKIYMDEVRAGFHTFLRAEEETRDARNAQSARNTRLAILLIVIAAALVGGLLAWLGRRQLFALSQEYETALRKQAEQNEALATQAWLRTGIADLGIEIRGDLPVDHLAEKILSFIVRYTAATAGALYVYDKINFLERRAGHAIDPKAPTHFGRGEGLVGQAGVSLRLDYLEGLPENYFKFVSGLGEARPHSVVVAPLAADGRLEGVVELAFFESIPSRTKSFLEQAGEIVGVAIRSANYRARLQDLLAESQQLTEELQTQQEELKVSNEELAERTKILLETQARLESQHAELEQTNEQLEEQAQVLEHQAQALDAQNRDLEDARAIVEDKARELEISSRYKSEFLANMSHELRTPLNSSLILAKLLMDNPHRNLTGEQVEFASTIYSSGNDLLNLINDILDLSKVEAGKLELHPEKVGIPALLAHLERTVRPLARERKLEFKVELSPAVPENITSDRQRLEQILRNLLSNALKFTPNGSVTLAVNAPKPGRLAFAVKDTGIGIRSDQFDVIFEAFRQADGTTNRKYGGTGLGLSISKNLAHLLGGELKVESRLGAGSVFTLELPEEFSPREIGAEASEPAPVPVAAPTRAKPEPTAPAVPPRKRLLDDDRDRLEVGKRTLLIVEDEYSFARIMYDLGHELGFQCLVSDTTQEGFELAKRHLPNAILLDMRLPDALGLSLLDRLKAEPKTRHIPVQAVSVSDYSREALHLGAVGYSLKPIDREALKKVLRDIEKKLERRTKQVLLIEDDVTQRMAIEKLIGEKGVEITSVGSGREGLEKIAKTSFDCAVIDLSLPDMSGFDLLEKMADSRELALPPVIVYTGHSLTRAEEDRLSRYSRSIIIKGARSPERLLDEVALFLHQAESAMSPERQKLLSASRNRDRAFEGRKILIVDDDVRNIFALTSALEMKGAQIVIARNGREAVAKVTQEQDIDIVLMDIMMPEMDGYEAMREIRKDKRFEQLPIIAVTAKAMRDDYESCLEAGANDYLAKPIEVDKLLALIRVWLPKQFGRA